MTETEFDRKWHVEISETFSRASWSRDYPFPYSPRFMAVNVWLDFDDDEGVMYCDNDDEAVTPPGHQRTDTKGELFVDFETLIKLWDFDSL